MSKISAFSRKMIAVIGFLVPVFFSCLSEDPANNVSYEATNQPKVNYIPATSSSVSSFQSCYDHCATDPANCDMSSSGICFPNMLNVQICQTTCDANKTCFPWDRNESPNPICRWSDDEYECNFTSCEMASFDCNKDCFRVYATTSDQAGMLANCQENCYLYYGCKPKPSNACVPLPDGYVYCGCPNVHGVDCHPADYASCP